MNRIFVFPGQGCQFIGMGKDIYSQFTPAKDIFNTVDDILKKPLSKIIFEGNEEELNKTENTQVAIMTVCIALLETLKAETGKSIDQLCSFVAGHSAAEYIALYAAGSISLQDATNLLKCRGHFMQEACQKSQGAMAACIKVPLEYLQKIIKDVSRDGVCKIANDNSSTQVVISGQKNLVERVIMILKDLNYRAIPLKVSGAFHSDLMIEAQKMMSIEIEKTQFQKPLIPIIMNTAAKQLEDVIEIKNNLKQQIVSNVRWRETINYAITQKLEITEIGPGKVLSNLALRDQYPFNINNISDTESLKDYIQNLIKT